MHIENKSALLLKKDKLTRLYGSLRMVSAEITFGTPSQHCTGHGICMVMPEGARSASQCPRSKAMFFRTSNAQLGMWVATSWLAYSVLEKQFSKPYFLVEETFELPDFIVQGLGFHGKYSVPRGCFGYRRTGESILLVLPLNKMLLE